MRGSHAWRSTSAATTSQRRRTPRYTTTLRYATTSYTCRPSGITRIPVLAGFVGAAALIGPAVKGLDPGVDFAADTRYRRELAAAIESLMEAINTPPPYVHHDDDDERDEQPEGGPESEQEIDAPVDDAVSRASQ